MEAVALISHLLRYVLAIVAILFCVALFRRQRACGWLLVGVVFLEPFVFLFMRAMRGRPWLAYKSVSASPDGVMEVSYRLDFPFFYIAAVVGLFMLMRGAREKVEGFIDEP